MKSKPIIGPEGTVLAYEQDNTSEIVLLAPGGKVLGKYLKNSGTTITVKNEIVSYKSNTLSSLLPKK